MFLFVGLCLIFIYGFNVFRLFENVWVVIIIIVFLFFLINVFFFLELIYFILSKFKLIVFKFLFISLIYYCFILLFVVLGLGYFLIVCVIILEFIIRIFLYLKIFSILLFEKFNLNLFKVFFVYKNLILYGFLLVFLSWGEFFLISNFIFESFFGNYVFFIILFGGLVVVVM